MKLYIFIISSFVLSVFLINKLGAQSTMIEVKAGHSFTISLPSYMSKTTGLNSAATLQYKSLVKDVYGMVIVDTKEELTLAELNFTSIQDFYDNMMSEFLVGEEKRKISEPISKTLGAIKFMECDASYYDKESDIEINYLVGIVETEKAFYKVLSWSDLKNKAKFKEDFRKILYSLKD